MNLKLLVVTLALPLAAVAQDELGLDLSEAKTPAEFRPSIAFIGITAQPPEEPLTTRAKLLETELANLIVDSQRFDTVKLPSDAEIPSNARTCADAPCFDAAGREAGVHRVLSGTLTKAGPGTVLTLSGFDPTLPAVLPLSIESGEKQEKAQLSGFSGIAGKSQVQRDRDFVAKARGPFSELLTKLGTPLGTLVVDVFERTAVTRARGKELGTGSFEKPVAAGTYEVEVTAEGYLPFNSTVTVEPTKRTEVKVTLVAKPVERVAAAVATAEPAPAFYKRPGLYVALVGAILMGVGFSFGAMAKSTENRAVDGDRDGLLDITRAEANNARTQALLANVFVATGAVALAAGAVWAIVIPMVTTRSSGQAPLGPSQEEPSEGSGFGLQAVFGGTF